MQKYLADAKARDPDFIGPEAPPPELLSLPGACRGAMNSVLAPTTIEELDLSCTLPVDDIDGDLLRLLKRAQRKITIPLQVGLRSQGVAGLSKWLRSLSGVQVLRYVACGLFPGMTLIWRVHYARDSVRT